MYVKNWSSKYLLEGCKTIGEMITALKKGTQELEAMRDDGIELEHDVGVGHGNAMLVTEDRASAGKYAFYTRGVETSERCDVMSPSHPSWNQFCDMVEESLHEQLCKREGGSYGYVGCGWALSALEDMREEMEEMKEEATIDIWASLEFFYANGARSDREILDMLDTFGRSDLYGVDSLEDLRQELKR